MLLNSKHHIDRREAEIYRHEAEVSMNGLLFNNTSRSPKQKSPIFYHIKRVSFMFFDDL